MVLLGSDVRRVPGAGARTGWTFVLFSSALDAGRAAQRISLAAAEAKAGKSLQRFERGGISWRLGAPHRRRRARRRHYHRDGATYAPGLRYRIGGADAAGARGSGASLPLPARVRARVDRPAVNAQRAGGPGDRIGSRNRADDAPRARIR